MHKSPPQAGVQLRLDGGSEWGEVPSAARMHFHDLLRRVEIARASLAEWGEALPRWRERYHQQVMPLYRQREELDLALLQLLDHAHVAYKLSKAERSFLSELIQSIAGPLIECGHENLKPLHNRHGSVALDAEPAGDSLTFSDVAASEFGLEPDELHAVESSDEWCERLRERMAAKHAHAQQRASARKDQRKAAPVDASPPPLRELYRRLATALHPDREPEPARREHKTALMQRLNQAYVAGNLLGLIELQLEIGQLQPQQLQQLSDARIQDYNRDLGLQLKRIERELAQVEMDFRTQYALRGGNALRPGRLDTVMAQIKGKIVSQIALLRGELDLLQDATAFRRWLKQQRQMAIEREE